MKLILISGRRQALAALLGLLLAEPGLFAHTRPVHQDLVEFAYETLLYLSDGERSVAPPEKPEPPQWQRFLDAAKHTPAKWRNEPAALPELGVSTLEPPPVKHDPAIAQLTCSNGELIAGTWWNMKMGEVRFP